MQEWLALLRRLARRPGFPLAVLITLALGVGANTVTFDLLYGYLLAPLPYARSEQLVNLYLKSPSIPGNLGMSYRTYLDLRQSSTALADAGIIAAQRYNLTAGSRAMPVVGASISASLLTTLGVPPLLGRPFGPGANKPGAAPQVLISERLWSRLFDRDPTVTSKSVRLDGTAYAVTGVMPERFQLLDSDEDVWAARTFEPQEADPDKICSCDYTMIVRLRPSASLGQLVAQAQATLSRELGHYPRASLFHKLRLRMAATPLRSLLLGDLSEHLLLAQLATGLLLLLIWFNLANLFIARALQQRGELVLRRVLGAQTPVLFLELLGESVTLCLPGSAAGFLVGRVAVRALLQAGLVSAALPPARDVWVVAGIALLLALLSALMFALAGLHFIRRQDLAQALKDMEVHSSGGRGERRIRAALVIIQLTIACLLTAVGTMLAHSLIKLGTQPLGFRPDSLVTFQIETRPAWQDRPVVVQRIAQLRHTLATVPGVAAATIANSLPFADRQPLNVAFPYPFDGKHTPSVITVVTDTSYFRTLALPLRQGHPPQTGSADELPEAVVDVQAAQALFGSTNVVGREFNFYGPNVRGPNMLFRISGVAGETRRTYTAASDAMGSVYLDRNQVFTSWFYDTSYVAVRTPLPQRTILPALSQALQKALPGVPLYDLRTMDQRLSQQLAPRRGLVTLVLIFAASALLVAAVGLYAVASYTVSQRRPELGIRAALGADQARLRRLVLRQTGLQLAIGMPLGLAGAAIFGRALAGILYGVEPADGLSLALVSAVLVLVTLIAAWVPAWRAGRVSPLEAIRQH